MTLKGILIGLYTQLRSMWMVFSHTFHKRDTIQYPETKVYLPPRYRGRIVLTRDPDGEERCVACNLCAVACPAEAISMVAAERKKGEESLYREEGCDNLFQPKRPYQMLCVRSLDLWGHTHV